MRLSELTPRWVADYWMPEGVKQGVGFECPCCRGTNRATRLAIFFEPTICGSPTAGIVLANQTLQAHIDQAEHGHLEDHHIGRIIWHREGDTFENLTLTPSVDGSHFGHWHGHVTNGEIQ